MDLNQKKEQLKRELARLEQKEKYLKKQSEAKNIKAITDEILKYDIPKYDNLKKWWDYWYIFIIKVKILKME